MASSIGVDEVNKSIERIDTLLASLPTEGSGKHWENLRIGLGIRLALGMGLEIAEKKAPGANTSDMVLDWSHKYQESFVNEVIALAREFLIKPAQLKSAIEQAFHKERDAEPTVNHSEMSNSAMDSIEGKEAGE